MPPLEHLLLFWPAWWSGSRVCVHGRVLPRNHEADIASGAVLSLRRRRPDIHVTAPCRRRDDPSMFSLGLSPHALRARRAPDACAGGTPGANARRELLASPMELDHETGTTALSGVWGVRWTRWPAGARASASVIRDAPSISQMSQGVGRCHVEAPPRRATSPELVLQCARTLRDAALTGSAKYPLGQRTVWLVVARSLVRPG